MAIYAESGVERIVGEMEGETLIVPIVARRLQAIGIDSSSVQLTDDLFLVWRNDKQEIPPEVLNG